jgi:hypothetical protein
MGGALPVAIRHQIIELKGKGNNLLSISAQLHVSYSTVQRIWKRYTAEGDTGVIPRYSHCGQKRGVTCSALIYRAALWLKWSHPDWGASLIRLILQDRYHTGEAVAIPSERSFQRWFKQHNLYKPKSRFPVLPIPEKAHKEHDIWQIDAKEKFYLSTGEKACYLTVVDEKSGCLLKTFVFPPVSISVKWSPLCYNRQWHSSLSNGDCRKELR